MPKRILFALLLMGFTSLIVQTLLIREFLISFYGNELTIGLILANWIMLEALGSIFLNKTSVKVKNPHLAYALLQAAISLYLPVSLFLIRGVKSTLGLTTGEGIGVLPILFSSLFILAPLSFFDGAQFPFGCRMLSEGSVKAPESAGKVYIYEAMGFILAGPIFTYILITKLNSFSIAFFVGLLNLSSAILLLKNKLKASFTKYFFICINILFILALLSFFGLASKLHQFSIDKQWQGQRVLSYRNSVYANLVVAKSGNQYTFYNDGIPIITTPTPDIASIEELVHFTMLSHPNPKNVLLLNGGAGGVIGEILKYPIDKLTYTELDPLLIKLLKDFPTELTKRELNNPKLDIQYIDGRRFLQFTSDKYDIILLNLPLPSTLQLNRFFTEEFFRQAKSVLNENGIFGFSLIGSLSYINQPMRNLNGSILNTLKSVFYSNPAPSSFKGCLYSRRCGINIIPGDFNLFLASKSEFIISPEDILSRLKEKNIQTRLLNRMHIEQRLHQDWLDWFYNSLSDYSSIKKNSDLAPCATFYSVSYWSNIFSPKLEWLFKTLDKLNFKALIILVFIFGVFLFIITRRVHKLKRAPIGFAMCSTGFIGMSLNLILIYAYQSFYGFVFSHLALLVTAFMAGLTLGGGLMTKSLMKIKNDTRTFIKIELTIIIFCLLAGPLLLYLNRLPALAFSFLFFLLSALSGALVGLEFPLANKIYWQEKEDAKTATAGILYALDLFGGCLAALVVSVAFVPVIGIPKTCLILAALKAVSLMQLCPYTRNRRLTKPAIST